jgi:D-beta-D-heptose 7-phosphate kinase/D-beta-D-heptose 1-phosphate adenosyltransferase
VPVVRLEREDYRLGGAANVAANVAALTGVPSLVGVVGADDAGRRLSTAIVAGGMDAARLVEDATRPTTEKIRAVTERQQQVARIDRESTAPLSGAPLAELIRQIAALDACSAIIVSDYGKGVITRAVLDAAVEAASRHHCPLIVDPKVPDAAFYRGATVITPNHREAEAMTGLVIRDRNDARTAAHRIHAASGASVLMTWGERGMWVMDTAETPALESVMPAAAREVSDVTGAGDTVIATLALALAAGSTLSEAAALANLAAGIAVGHFGPVAVSAAELLRA